MPTILLSIIICSMPLYLIRLSVFGVPTTVLEIIIYLCFIAWLVYRWQKGKQVCSDNKYTLSEVTAKSKGNINWRLPWVLWAWLVVGLISALINPDFVSGLGQWKALFFDGALVFIIIFNEYKIAKAVVPKALISIGAIIATISLAGFWGWNLASDGRWLGWYGLETYASPNYLSLFLAPILAMSLVASFLYKNWWRALSILSSVLIIIALVGTQSRGAAIGVVGAIIITTLWWCLRDGKKQYHWLGWSALALIVIAGATFWLAAPDFNASPEDGRVATSNNVRLFIWQTSIEMFGQKPILGVGLGNYQNYFNELTADRVNYPEYISPLALSAHNLYLNILVTMGGIGLIIFMWMLIATIINISKRSRSIDLCPVVATFAAIIFYGLVDTPFFKNDLAIMWWVVIALLISKNED